MEQKLDLQSTKELKEQIELLERRVERERHARKAAEALLEEKSLELYESNIELRRLNENLEKIVLKRTNTLSSLIRNLHAGILLEDENRRVMLVNDKFCEFFDVPLHPDELIGMECAEAVAASKDMFENPDEFEKRVDQLIHDKAECLNEQLIMHSGRVLERDFVPIILGSEYAGHLWKYRDITSQFNSAEQIRASEEKYRGIMENMELGLLEVDENHIILKAYDRFCDMTGYSRNELEGQNANDLLLPEKYQKFMVDQDAKRKQGKQSIYEVELRRKNGDMIWVLISGAPFFNEDGELVGSIGIHYDITKRKHLEYELRQAREVAESARKAEKEFLANMSHEIRNPINAIAGLINLLYDTQLNSEQLDYLNNIKFSAEILLGLISDVLDLSKIEAGEMELNERDLMLPEAVTAVVQTYRFKTANDQVRFEVDIDPAINFRVMADPTILNQVLLNLISNAVKFTEKGTIKTQVTLVAEREEEVEIKFSVKDTGIGIEADQLAEIFESFKQGSKQTKLKYGGTGLGLSIVKKLVDMYGGDIKVNSHPGQGSEFIFHMIFKKLFGGSLLAEPKEDQPSVIPSQINHVLVVEDNKVNQMYLTGLLKKWGITYDMANHGGEAIDLLDKNAYDLILMDIRMPVMDGYETTIRIRSSQNNRNSQVPIVALTASALVDEKEKALAAGMNQHLTKPFSPDQLLAILDQLTEIDMSDPGNFEYSKQLDREYLDSFYGEDLERAQLMFEIFLSNIESDLTEMKSVHEVHDWTELASLAHRIKPNFVMVGLGDLTDRMLAIENASKDADSEMLEKIVPEFFQEFKIKHQIVRDELVRINTALG